MKIRMAENSPYAKPPPGEIFYFLFLSGYIFYRDTYTEQGKYILLI